MASIFGRTDLDGNIAIFQTKDGRPVTRMENWAGIYPVGSRLSAAYEHPEGIIISREDAEEIGIEIEE